MSEGNLNWGYFVLFEQRVNPLFEEDGYSKGKKRWHNYLKESSSGYSSDHINAGFEGDKSFQKESVTILEQNTSFVKSILVAVRGKKQSSTLNPIPEDQNIRIDYTIPRPVWPRNEKYKKQPSYKNEERSTDWHSENEKSASPQGSNFIIRPKAGYEEKADSTKDILKDLAETINLAIDQKDQLSPEDLLKTLSETINKNWDMLSSDSAVRQLSRNLNQSEVATISRAFSHTSSFSEPYLSNRPLSDAEAGRLSLLKRLGKLSLYEPPAYEKHTRESSTSSEETSSGFSEFSPTPTTSSTADSPSSRRSPENSKVPLFTHENLSTVSNGLRNVVLYGSGLQCRDGQNEYEKLNFRDRKSSSEEKSEDSSQDLSSSNWDDTNVKPSKQYEAQYRTSNSTIPGYNFPDFTLDTHQAEKLMSKIQATKRQRCWCRMATCLFGLLFLLLSVMAVSMFLTRGQRMFGSL
ncbi:uncharacterized protein LOC108252742 [Diaphorina citri]|uniref:Uncharacterized protein LOC108252742 n=1 Tax=Diaphorina citri TaxID=121845 RepID=A0A3Q0IZ23_DIACI|nr:uncharacterized protein LOC108252742 [Diaphorina citri]